MTRKNEVLPKLGHKFKHCPNISAPVEEARLAELTRAGVILNVWNRVYGRFFNINWSNLIPTMKIVLFKIIFNKLGLVSWKRELWFSNNSNFLSILAYLNLLPGKLYIIVVIIFIWQCLNIYTVYYKVDVYVCFKYSKYAQ